MAIALRYTRHAVDDLRRIDKKVALRIVAKVRENAELSNPLLRAKPLTGPLAGMYRYRIGDWRVLFELDQRQQLTILMVLRVKHRKEVYD